MKFIVLHEGEEILLDRYVASERPRVISDSLLLMFASGMRQKLERILPKKQIKTLSVKIFLDDSGIDSMDITSPETDFDKNQLKEDLWQQYA